jgi:hypothetical protein
MIFKKCRSAADRPFRSDSNPKIALIPSAVITTQGERLFPVAASHGAFLAAASREILSL